MVDVIESVVVPSLTELGLVVDDAVIAFNFAGGEVTLEVLAIIGGVP
jgi:hypothetical protein